MGAADFARSLLATSRRQRRGWASAELALVEVRGLVAGSERIAGELDAALREVTGVEWVAVHPARGRVAVGLSARVELQHLVAAVEEAETRSGVAAAPFPHGVDHPADREPLLREAVGAVAHVGAMGFAVAGRLARVARVPMEVAGVVPFLQHQPRVRDAAEAIMGTPAAEATFAIGGALAQGLAQGALGLAVDLAQRVNLLGEVSARQRLWHQRAVELTAHPAVGGDDVGERPVPLGRGPVETFSDRAGVAALAALGGATAATRSPRRGMATMLAFTPKAAHMGRDAFAAHLGRELAGRGVLCMDATVLRRLDRLDAVVIDGARLRDPSMVIEHVLPLGGVDLREARRRVAALFDPGAATAVVEDGRWRLAPLERVEAGPVSLALRRRSAEVAGDARLVLSRDGEPVALVGLSASVAAGGQAVVAAAHRAGLLVVVADPDVDFARRAGSESFLDAALGTVEAVRRLQADGFGVAALAGDDAPLAAADCGIGLLGGGVPWAADLLCPDWRDACFVMEAIGVAHEVSRQSAALSLGASSMGAALSVLSTPAQAARSASGAVNTGALLAIANGVRAAAALARRPLRLAAAPPAWHELEVEEVLTRLDASLEGLAVEAAHRRHARPAGLDDEGVSFGTAVLEELANPMTPVLAGAAAVSGVVGSLADAGLVASVLAANGMLGGVQRYRVERAIHALEQTSGAQIRVRRDGRFRTLAADELVVGDVVRLQVGDWVPADCRIIAAKALEVEQAGLTGESAPVAKDAAPCSALALDARACMLYEGSSIAAGRADAVVVAVAPDTELRRAADGAAPPPSGVETRLQDLTRVTIPVVLGGGGLVLASGLLRSFPVRRGVETAVSLAVAAVPEGLPLLATMAQLAAARRLSARGALVRNPRALEALGRVNVLCCDKTGTLTEGHIVLAAVHDGVALRDLDDLGSAHRGVVAAAVRASPRMRSDGEALPHLTDRAVLDGATRCGIGADGDLPGWEKGAELPFEPARGYHAVVGQAGIVQRLSVKGAPEVVLPRCERWRRDGHDQALDRPTRRRLGEEVDRLGRRGYRLLAVAEREASGRADLDDARVSRLTLLGFVALIDPVRPATAAAVAAIQHAGISVVMLTGDHPSTAEGVAVELGVLDGGRTLTGPELDALGDGELDAILDEVGVFARVTPTHKTRLVAAYQRRGRVVAMTGDGANDAPAIRLADVGIALGAEATPAARAAADVLVPDGRIETLVDAIVEGRALWASVREAIAILVGGNLGEVAFTLIGSLATGQPPLGPRQLLLVNLLTDIAPAIVIAIRPPRDGPEQLLAEGPERSLGTALERAIAARALTTAAGATAAWAGARLTGRSQRASTVSLVGLVGAQLGQTLKTGGRNPAVAAAALGSAAVLAGIVQTPGVSQFFGCTPLGPLGWAIGLGSATAATLGSDLSDRLVGILPHLRTDDTASAAPAGIDRREPTRAALYQRAQELGVPGRSRMTKQQLLDAVRQHETAADAPADAAPFRRGSDARIAIVE